MRSVKNTPTRLRGGRLRTAGLMVAVGAMLAGALSGCGSTEPRNLLDSIREGSVVLGVKFDQPGLGLYEPDGNVEGFDASVSTYVVNHIADELGVPHPEITWRETPSARREAMIDNGEVDLIAATYSINAARSKKVTFGGPYLVTYQGLLVRADDNSITELPDLDNGKKLCSVTGSTSAQNVKAQLPAVQLQEYDSYSACVEALRRGKVDALTTDEAILAGYANFWKGEFKRVEMTYLKDACVKDALKKAGSPFSTERYGVGLALNDTASQEAVNKALDAMLTPDAGDASAWNADLRESLGNAYVDDIIARGDRPDSKFPYKPDPGDLDFLDSPSTPCPPGLQ
ncbi:transporter substrate-binding domain-containing protein [Gordonia jinghuaiqii]|uniref:Glutamate ABC transporter substrate-binding protein n=1 Tax=Gordonia jinghuaiqii TaxID=2758710 RepID=A0A7D7QSI5_9ACTN|nr:glutamate ABC transporter substrate-binding protein [Gordonia jinghuaiqii]MCR5976258.1 transporter substrate-binding domain-containing protein [Gordonia jinghuaiqii]QMT03486.1 glutamate ABC transporter substrate-binding protein [Gordonia jinghuaiqii]